MPRRTADQLAAARRLHLDALRRCAQAYTAFRANGLPPASPANLARSAEFTLLRERGGFCSAPPLTAAEGRALRHAARLTWRNVMAFGLPVATRARRRTDARTQGPTPRRADARTARIG